MQCMFYFVAEANLENCVNFLSSNALDIQLNYGCVKWIFLTVCVKCIIIQYMYCCKKVVQTNWEI